MTDWHFESSRINDSKRVERIWFGIVTREPETEDDISRVLPAFLGLVLRMFVSEPDVQKIACPENAALEFNPECYVPHNSSLGKRFNRVINWPPRPP
jgi:hypothetical protein